MWEQSGNKTRQTPSKTGYNDIGKGKTNQPLTIWVSALQAGGQGFKSPHVHQSNYILLSKFLEDFLRCLR
jgi:hypothetical protein